MNKYNKDVQAKAFKLLAEAIEESLPIELYDENGNELRIRDFWATIEGIALEIETIE